MGSLVLTFKIERFVSLPKPHERALYIIRCKPCHLHARPAAEISIPTRETAIIFDILAIIDLNQGKRGAGGGIEAIEAIDEIEAIDAIDKIEAIDTIETIEAAAAEHHIRRRRREKRGAETA